MALCHLHIILLLTEVIPIYCRGGLHKDVNSGGRDCWGLANHTEYVIASVLNMRKLRLEINNLSKVNSCSVMGQDWGLS